MEFRINRNIVECKCLSVPAVLCSLPCINRNIVECKYSCICDRIQCARGINRNIVECKFWNAWICIPVSSVLIETLWNVNIAVTEGCPEAPRINRNIVECKF